MIRKILGTLRQRFRQEWVHRRRQRGTGQAPDWPSGLLEENDFWTRALTDPARNWNLDDYRERTDPKLELQPELRALIPAAEGETVRILDVGAGPLTRLGKTWPGRHLEIIATDPLAEQYNALVKRLNVPQLVPVIVAHAETLTERFPRNHFDLAYASNCLDHSCDPVQAIRQMLDVVKPGCCAYLWHFTNEGKQACYEGLHQWNFFMQNGRFMISDARTTCSLDDTLGATAEITCQTTRAFDSDVIIATLRKRLSA